MMTRGPTVHGFYDEDTGSVAYVVADPGTGRCAVIDPVLGFDRDSSGTDTRLADEIAEHIRARGLTVEWVLDTHPHADHLSAVAYLGERLGAPTGIGERVAAVQEIWADIYNLPDLRTDGRRHWDRLFAEGDRFQVGGLEVEVVFSPGHTAASVTYLVGDAAFVHDTLFMPDSGTARADFPGGDARTLFHSIRRLLALPPQTRLFMCHDYGPNGREIRWETTVGEERAHNIHVHDGIGESQFVAMRTARDKTLDMPRLIIPSIQVNMRAGALPPADASGRHFLKVPVNAL
jgi:glyoxylase-like metal-dependent hydrolase (beta-lactamase superfamily II)